MRYVTVILFFFLSFCVRAETLVRALASPPVTLDPHYFFGVTEAAVLKDLFEGLVVQDELGLPAPGAARSWNVSDDGRTWIFHLRDKLKWSDGTPFTSEDFLYSFRRLADPVSKAAYSWYLQLSGIVNSKAVAEGSVQPDALGVTAPDSGTLVIQLEEPRSWFLSMMTFPSFLPVPRHSIEVCGEQWYRQDNCAVSNGAYHLNSCDDKAIRLTRNQHYHSLAEVNIPEVAWQVFSNPVDELIAFRAGELDIGSGSLLGALLTSFAPTERIVEPVPQLITSYLLFNPREKVLADHNLRRALEAVLDRSAILSRCGELAWTMTPPWTKGAGDWLPQDCEQPQWQRDQLARKALIQAGYSADKPAEIEYLTVEGYCGGGLRSGSTVDSIVAQWRRLPGVEVKIISLSPEELTRRYLAGDFQVIHGAWLAAFNDPAAFLLLGSSLSPYSQGVMGKDYDRLLHQAIAEQSTDRRQKLYQQLEQQLIDSKTIIPLKHLSHVRWLQPRVKGFATTNPEGWVATRQMRIE